MQLLIHESDPFFNIPRKHINIRVLGRPVSYVIVGRAHALFPGSTKC
jgi:hypothetical protein